MLNRRAELLSPAGNMDCLKAAVSAGANAIYLGGKNFSARAFAGNFSNEEIVEAVKYAHLRDVRIYITINTLLNEKELENAKKQVKFYYENNVDALLIQDLGLYYWISQEFPDFEIHCSTQMHVQNIKGIQTAKKLGFKRVVIPRESSLEFIKEACKEDIEIETFVHGAICVSYSGQCLMSAFTKNRSANKGMCAQCCRLKYNLVDDDNHTIKTDTDYLLSTKDMCLVNDIPALIEAGVSSFKIEGRMKSPAYVSYVTSLYRKAIDSYYSGIHYKITNEELNNLKILFNRNFTNDYLYKKDDLFGQKTPNHLGFKIGETTGFRNSKLFIKLDHDLNQFDGIRIDDYGCIINRLYKDGLLVNGASKGDLIAIDCKENKKGSVYKTLDAKLESEALNIEERKLPINIEIDIYPNKPLTASVSYNDQVFTYSSEIIAQNALKKPLDEASIHKQLNKLNETVYSLNSLKVNTENAFLPVSELNAFRRQLIESFDAFRINSFKRNTPYRVVEYFDALEDEIIGKITVDSDTCIAGNTIYKSNNVINNGDYTSDIPLLMCDFSGILDKTYKIAGTSLNCINSYTYEFLKKIGFKHILLSLETKEFELNDLIKSYVERNETNIHPFVYEKGSKTLMYIHSDPFGKYTKKDKKYYLEDGNNRYEIIKENGLTLIKEIGEEQLLFIQK